MLVEAKGRAGRARRVRLSRETLPALALAAGAVAVAVFAAVTAVQVTAVGLDENVYKFAAVQHYDDFPFGVLYENTSRGLARLYSLLISPLFAVFYGDVAVRVARAFNGVLFAATAVPVALLARRVTTSPWSAVGAGVLTIAVPWLTLTTVMFSESLSYLLFACVALAMMRALEAPSTGREALVLGLIAALVLTRVQFLVLGPAWVLIVLVAEVVDARREGLGRRDGRVLLRRLWERHRLTVLAIGAAVALVLVAVLVNRFRSFAGPYYGILQRDTIPGSFGLGMLWEVAMLSLGVGVLPAALAILWLARSLSGRAPRADLHFALFTVTVLALLFAATLWAQGGFLGQHSEERYFVYAIPCVWIAAAAALERRDISRGSVALAALGVAAVIVLVPNPIALDGEQAYLGPVSLSLAHAMPGIQERLADALGLAVNAVQPGDVLALACVVVTGAFLLGHRRGRGVRWLALTPAIALQLFFVGYGFSSVYDELEGVGGTVLPAKFEELGWIDRGTGGDARVTLLDNQLVPAREGAQRNTIFWNDEVTDVYGLAPAALPPLGFPVALLDVSYTPLGDDNRVILRLPFSLMLTGVDSPLWQLEGERVLTSPDGTLAVDRASTPAPYVKWAALGLDADGQLTRPIELRALGGYRVALTAVSPRGEQSTQVELDLGGRTRTLTVPPLTPKRFAVDLCGLRGPQRGRLNPSVPVGIDDGRVSAALITAVRLERC